ncbi:me53 [Hyphantria cunea granulovirus]|uniref:Me53 n=1 Tax=Hyphantria cunea granulovirus TaxID=307448 RepID=A0AAE6D0L8_9BBAC|nr:me53 [Hyphantria cunea granulovirus]QBQ01684.1 me53 [Hyphantria cunea granulovirus]
MADDIRVQFLARETREVLNFVIDLALNIANNNKTLLNYNINCCECKLNFKHIYTTTLVPYIFVPIKNWLLLETEDIQFCCLMCSQQMRVMDLIEIYPTITLHNLRKLMYNKILKIFVFNFVNSEIVHCKRYIITESLEHTLDVALREKSEKEEIEKIVLLNNSVKIAQDTVTDLRVDYGKYYLFSRKLAFNRQLVDSIVKPTTTFVLEVYYKEFKDYQPFMVYFNKCTVHECEWCRGKLWHNTVPILFCSQCGFTDPQYWFKKKIMMVPFWKGNYNYAKTYWKIVKKSKTHPVTLMLYDVNVSRDHK